MRFKLLTLALIAGALVAAVPAMAQDDTSTTPTPTVTTPTTPADTTETAPAAGESTGDESSDESLPNTGSNTVWLLAIGGALALGSALLLARERRPRRNR